MKVPGFVWYVLGAVFVFFVCWVLKVEVHIGGGAFGISCGLFR